VTHRFLYDANLLCLDLVNTVQIRGEQVVDLLEDFTSVVWWLVGAGVLDRHRALSVLSEWRGSQAELETYQTALALRHATIRIADRMREGRPVQQDDLAPVNAVLASRPLVDAVVAASDGYQRVTRPVSDHPAGLLGPVADSVARLVVELDPKRVGRCGSSDCILYFYDTTKNRGRRWCSMERCGNRAKAAAHYARERRGGAPPSGRAGGRRRS